VLRPPDRPRASWFATTPCDRADVEQLLFMVDLDPIGRCVCWHSDAMASRTSFRLWIMSAQVVASLSVPRGQPHRSSRFAETLQYAPMASFPVKICPTCPI
jgi:hypothetical protein